MYIFVDTPIPTTNIIYFIVYIYGYGCILCRPTPTVNIISFMLYMWIYKCILVATPIQMVIFGFVFMSIYIL